MNKKLKSMLISNANKNFIIQTNSIVLYLLILTLHSSSATGKRCNSFSQESVKINTQICKRSMCYNLEITFFITVLIPKKCLFRNCKIAVIFIEIAENL